MNSRHLYAISIIAAGLILWSGEPATASDTGKEMVPGGGRSSGSTNNSGVFNGVPDPNSPGGTKDAGTGSGGNTEIGTGRQGGEPDSGRSEPSGSSVGKPSDTASSSNTSSGGDSSGSSNDRSRSGSASNDMKADQGGQRQDAQVGDTHIDKDMKESEVQNAKAIKGEVLRIEGDQYYVAGEDGKEVGLHIDGTTQKTGDIQAGDRMEAQANEQNHALSIRSAPTTDRRNEHSSQ